MKKIVIIGAGEFQNPLILKAKDMGYETHVFAWECGDIGEQTADVFYPISIVEKKTILDACRVIKPEGIVSIASDLAAITVNFVAQGMGLVGNSMECTRRTTNKFAMRKALFEAGIPTPRFALLEENRLKVPADMQYPAIIKPTDRSGSRGIMKIEAETEIRSAALAAFACSFEKKAIIEEFLQGEEYSCECISSRGRHACLAFTKKFTTGAPHFIETGHVEPSDISQDQQQEIKKMVYDALNALCVTDGASHTEFRITPEGKIRIIEIGARMGGDCIGSHLVPLSTGRDFMRMVIEIACGNEPSFTRIFEPAAAAIRFVFSLKDVENLERVQKIAPRFLMERSPIKRIDPISVVDSSTRAGYYILSGDRKKIVNFLKF